MGDGRRENVLFQAASLLFGVLQFLKHLMQTFEKSTGDEPILLAFLMHATIKDEECGFSLSTSDGT